ncbi:MAG: matrixin family metalloprotease [Candidatus Moranbacteria bacterium]|nr:matrixin family metalloprotease [Candidatus Moranbacteria bacterium]
MRKIVNILLIGVSLGTIVYAAAPFLPALKDQLRRSATVDGPAAKESVTGTLREAAQKVGSVLHLADACSVPLHYAIGDVDPRFGISKEAFKEDLLKAEATWEGATKKDVLQYDAQAAFKVNLVFDERQQQTIEAKKLDQKLDVVQTLRKGISLEYDDLSDQYETKKSKYEGDVKRYKAMADAYEQRVEYWNDRGDAPDAEYAQLQSQRKSLNAFADDIEKQRKALNSLVGQLNDLVAKEQRAVDSYNKEVTTYESVHGSEKEFDQGVYTGTEITIYQFSDTSDLVLVLAHELGHALGMDHVENPKSIMYYLMSKQDIGNITPSAEDITALKRRCS